MKIQNQQYTFDENHEYYKRIRDLSLFRFLNTVVNLLLILQQCNDVAIMLQLPITIRKCIHLTVRWNQQYSNARPRKFEKKSL